MTDQGTLRLLVLDTSVAVMVTADDRLLRLLRETSYVSLAHSLSGVDNLLAGEG